MITTESRGQVDIWHIDGRMTAAVASNLQHRVADFFAAGKRYLVLELSAVSVLDSSGLGVLVAAQAEAQERRGGLALALPSSQVRAVLELTRLDQVLPLYDSVVEAVAELASSAETRSRMG